MQNWQNTPNIASPEASRRLGLCIRPGDMIATNHTKVERETIMQQSNRIAVRMTFVINKVLQQRFKEMKTV